MLLLILCLLFAPLIIVAGFHAIILGVFLGGLGGILYLALMTGLGKTIFLTLVLVNVLWLGFIAVKDSIKIYKERWEARKAK